MTRMMKTQTDPLDGIKEAQTYFSHYLQAQYDASERTELELPEVDMMQYVLSYVVSLCTKLTRQILILSFMAPQHARALQAYYDGDELIIRKTDLLDFTQGKNPDALLLLTRLIMSTSIGDTISEKKRLATSST